MIKNIFFKYKEQISYLFFGGLTTLVNWIVYTISLKIFGTTIEVANVLAWLIAVIFAYITNKNMGSICGQDSFLLGKYLAVHWLGHMVGICLTFLKDC